MTTTAHVSTVDLGRLDYRTAFARQQHHHAEVLASRASASPETARLLLVEHDPVITVSRRPGAARHLVASERTLERLGVELVPTDRGGDITYHGPGQLVAYPICDLNRMRLSLHAYMRLLEQVVIDTLGAFDIAAHRDAEATGVWVPGPGGVDAKIAALGLRVRRWVSMHGVALNVSANLAHFDLIVPCGLVGRPVTSIAQLRPDDGPDLERVKAAFVEVFDDAVGACLRG